MKASWTWCGLKCLPAMLLALASLHGGAAGAADNAAKQATGAVPALSRYIGKYPYEKIDGVDFFHHPAVVKAVREAVHDPKIQRIVLSHNNPMTPLRESRGRLLMASYEAASAGSVNWALVLPLNGAKAAVCYAAGDPVQDVSGATWYYEGEEGFVLYLRCPHYTSELEQQTGDWPIGPMAN